MNNKNATVSIKSITHGMEEDTIELMTEGSFYEKNGWWYILYHENEAMGMADCSVIIKASEGEAVVSRKGDFSSRMEYIKGRATEFIYYTPYGSVPIIIDTEAVSVGFSQKGGEMRLKYFLSVQGDRSAHSMEITVRPDETKTDENTEETI